MRWSVFNTCLIRCACLLEGVPEIISLITQLGSHENIPQVTGLACGTPGRGAQKEALNGVRGMLCKGAGERGDGGGGNANLTTCQHRLWEAVCVSQQGAKTHLVVEVVKQPEHAMLVIRVSLIDVFQQLDLV